MSGEYYKTKESVEEYIQLAKDVSGAKLISQLQKYLPAKLSVLELGSGPGTDFGLLSKHYQVIGSDFSQEFLKHLRTKFSEERFLEIDATNITTQWQFDGIYANKVLHHLSDAELKQSVKQQYDILKEGGVICHSFWKGEGDEEFKGMFVNYHTKAELQALYEPPFEILYLEEYQEFEAGDSILLIAKKR